MSVTMRAALAQRWEGREAYPRAACRFAGYVEMPSERLEVVEGVA